MRVACTVLLLALGQRAAALSPGLPSSPTDEPGLASLDVSHGLRLSVERGTLTSEPDTQRSSVFTALYWSRAYEARSQLVERFGLHWAYGVSFDGVEPQGVGYTHHSPLGYADEARWSAKPVAGLRFERQNLFLQGDRFSLRATSDMQTFLREVGVMRSTEEVDCLSLLGWRSHSVLVWQVGEPTREIQWQFAARFDRRAYSQSNSANFSLLRRF